MQVTHVIVSRAAGCSARGAVRVSPQRVRVPLGSMFYPMSDRVRVSSSFPEIVRGGVLVEPSIRFVLSEKRRSRKQSRSGWQGDGSLDLDEENRSRRLRAHRFEFCILRLWPLPHGARRETHTFRTRHFGIAVARKSSLPSAEPFAPAG